MSNYEKIQDLLLLKKNLKSQFFYNENSDLKGKNLYFGTGLASVNNASSGFGIEILSTILTSLWLQKKFELNKVIHEISTIGYNIDEKTREELIKKEKGIIEGLITNLNLEDKYILNFSHDYHEDEEFLKIKREVDKTLKEFDGVENYKDFKTYTALQIAGMKYLYEKYDVRLKLGWITDKKRPLEDVNYENIIKLIDCGHLNEYYFDSFYRYVFKDDDYSFLYTPCALDFITGNRTVPYTVIDNQNRPLLDDKSLVEYCDSIPDSKLKNKIIKNWDNNIVKIFEELFYEIPIKANDENEETINKVEYIKNKVLGIKK